MWVILTFFAIMVLLLIFMIWDRRRLQSGKVEPLPREALAGGWQPKPPLVWPINAALALCALLLAASEFQAPSKPPFSGRLSFVYAAMHAQFGQFGAAYAWLGVALLFTIAAVVAWRSRALARPSATR